MKTFIIAGCGRNHMGDVNKAKEMILAAARSGCDAVKFQTYITERFVDPTHPEYKNMKQYELTYDQQVELKAYADTNKIEFMTTVFDEEGLFFVIDRLGLRRVKISAPLNSKLFHIANSYGNSIQSLHVMFHTGAWTETENLLKKILVNVKKITPIYSMLGNPTPDHDLNLSAITTLKWTLKAKSIGYCDFSDDFLAPSLAVISGADVVEKNLVLADHYDGPDLNTSITPQKMANMVSVIRIHEEMIGDGNISK